MDGQKRESAPAHPHLTFVFVMIALGVLVISRTAAELPSVHIDVRIAILAALTLISGRWTIKIPGRPLTLTVSEVFVFATILMFGATPATLIVAVDGLWTAVAHRAHPTRAPLMIAEPVVATWTAGQVFAAASRFVPLVATSSAALLWLPTAAMTGAYFLVYSVLMSAGTALESGASVYATWRQTALLLAVRQYSAASLAVLAGAGVRAFDPAVFGLVAPLLVLSYAAYREAATRVQVSQQHVKDLEHLYQATVETLAVAMDAKDQVTHGHIRRVQRHAIALGRAIGMSDSDELKALEAAALLHDVGKLAMPDYVLNKPGSLSQKEYETMKLHATKGATILAAVAFPYPVAPIVRHHHECWNGSGYPDGLGGEDIPLGARILSIVDCFDALTSDRPYRRKLRDEVAVQMLRERSATAFDPRLVEVFVKLIPELRRHDWSAVQDAKHLELALSDAAQVTDPGAEYEYSTAINKSIARVEAAGATTLVKATEFFPGAEACLFAVDPDGDSIYRVSATAGIQSDIGNMPMRSVDGLSAWVAANRHTIISSDPGLDLGDGAASLGLKSATATPVFAFGTVVAVLTVYTPERVTLTDRHGRLLGELAQEIGTELVRLERETPVRSERPRLARSS
jgi:putative nucleotidyltransferase with HDIG domain